MALQGFGARRGPVALASQARALGGGADGIFGAYDAATGEQLWKIDLQTGILAPPVTYTVDGAWRPLDAFVRLTRAQRFVGSAWFRFDDHGAECESWTANEGRLSQRVALSQRPRVFAPHPLVGDGWQAAAYDFSAGPGRVHLAPCTNSSPRHDGGSGPAIGVVQKDLEYVGDETLTVAAGTFRVRHLRIHHLMPWMSAWTPLEFWVTPEDCLLVRMRWDTLRSTYDLVELEGTPR